MRLIDFLVQELPRLGGWKDRDIQVVIDKTSVIVNIKGDEAAGLIGSRILEIITREQYEAALAASKKVEWDGSFPPPVGIECQAKYREAVNAECFFFRCVGVDCGVAFGWAGKDAVTLGKGSYEFRPIRSESDKKRDAVAEALIRFLDTKTNIDNVFTIKDVSGFFDYISAGEIPHIRIG
ncbi:TPA: hypothetical protein ACGSHR_002930 [Escherichia coli]|uniref:hypothetical protein n=1 Tax=Escherichia coli TaxID=562 RepID=UPI0013314313|nr:hypothetical protein [Escherichia coli]